jgi:hypothetical protein
MEGANLSTFITCIKSIHLLHLILGFTFNVWALYSGFHKVNVINITCEKNYKLNSRNNGYIYNIHGILEPISYFKLYKLFV